MNRTKSVQVIAIGLFLLTVGSMSYAQVNRQGWWTNQPEREKGTAFFEREMEKAPVPPLPTPVPPKPTPAPTAAPTKAPEPVPPKPPMDVPYENIYFDFDKSELRPHSKEVLAKVADYLKHYPDIAVTVYGHTCDIGTDKYNEGLSNRRAESAKGYLIRTLNVSPDRIKVIGKGEREPALPNTSEANREKNRRCEFSFSNR